MTAPRLSTPPGRPPAVRRVSDRNLVLVLVGAVLVVASLQGLQWYSIDTGQLNVAGSGFTAADLHANADSLGAAVAAAYFDWLAWTLLVLGGIAAVGATIPSPLTDPLRVAAFGLGLLGALGGFYAVAQLFAAQRAAGGSSHAVFHGASFGLWSCLGGFVLILLGGALGPRRG